MTALAGTSIILGAVYMLNLYKRSFFGSVTNDANKTLSDLDGKEMAALVPLVLIVVWLGVYPKPVLVPIDNSVKALTSFMHEKAQTKEAKATILVSKTRKEMK
jgi:NADH-quinone oxidoreductase subunit M